ncbi:MAG: ATP synthase subunit I [[Eubacterium] siraeum]
MKKKITETTSFKECMALLPYYIGALVLLGIVSVILIISGIGDYTLLTGAVAGTAVSALNFVLMAISAEKAITLTEKSAKLAMNGSYGARYIGTFIILGVLMFFKDHQSRHSRTSAVRAENCVYRDGIQGEKRFLTANLQPLT